MQYAWLVLSYTTSSLLHGPHFYLKQDDALIGRVLHENPELMVMGSCVLVMLMKDEDVYIMNVGDSRAVVAQQHSKSLGSLSHVGHAQPNGLTVEEPPEKSTGVRDTLLRLELDKIIEEAPTESKGLKLKNGSRSLASDPAPGSLLLDALQLSSDHSTSILEVDDSASFFLNVIFCDDSSCTNRSSDENELISVVGMDIGSVKNKGRASQ